jgi:hypothetical protein
VPGVPIGQRVRSLAAPPADRANLEDQRSTLATHKPRPALEGDNVSSTDPAHAEPFALEAGDEGTGVVEGAVESRRTLFLTFRGKNSINSFHTCANRRLSSPSG